MAVAVGFAVTAAGMLAGATTSVGSGEGFVLGWIAIVGLGFGLSFATAASAALSELSPERSGVGSAILQALKNVGAPFGAAVLGSALISAYRADLQLVGVPATVQQSVFAGLAVAHQLRSPALAASVRVAFVHGMDVSLLVSAGIAGIGIVLTLAFLPGRAAKHVTESVLMQEVGTDALTR